MASYLQKLRKQSKQPAAQQTPTMQEPPKADTPKTDIPKVEEAAPNASGSVPHSHAPTVTEVSDEPAAEPVLDEEDQRFLERLAAIAQEPEGIPPQLPARPTEVIGRPGEKMVGKDAQEALMAGADKIALPQSPPEGGLGRKKSVLSYFALPKFKKGDKQKDTTLANKGKAGVTEKDRTKLADDLLAVAQSSKSAELTEAEKEQQDLTNILEELNLSAVNNRVFSFSKESEELLSKFTLVLKDIVNGAPTAYNDLEKLFTDYDAQLKKMYGGLPPFLQNLVKGLPAKLTASLGPEFLAAQAEKPGFDAKQRAAGSSTGKRSKIPGIPTIPSLKQLVTAQGAVATALRSILNFLKFRFPALAGGTNMLMSLAVFLLLFVFWYCHKRGRETRLEKERLAAEGSAAASSASSVNEDNDSIFGDKKPQLVEGEPTPTLVVGDDKEGDDRSAAVKDLPSVAHLPDPTKVSAEK